MKRIETCDCVMSATWRLLEGKRVGLGKKVIQESSYVSSMGPERYRRVGVLTKMRSGDSSLGARPLL